MSESIYLRPLVLEDATTSYRWRNNPDIWKYTPFNPSVPITLEMETEWLDKTIGRADQKRFAICLTENEKYIGNVQLIDIVEGEAEFHLFIGEQDYWGRGIGEKATELILNYAFFTLDLDSVKLDVNRENVAAIKIYTRQGFVGLDGSKDSFMMMRITKESYHSNNKSSRMKYIIKIEQETEWKNLVKRAFNYDFYHSWTYHSLDNTSGIPMLFVYEEDNDFIAIPLLKREIQDSEYYDMTSVYGYSGPISNKAFHKLPSDLLTNFRTSFLEFLKEEKIVTVFSRLNPFFNQVELMEDFGGVVDNGKVVVLDLSISLDEQQKSYQERVLRKVKSLKKKGFYVKESSTKEDIRTFTAIYTLNMLRVDATSTYYFDEAYFETLLNSDEFDARLIFVYDKDDYAVCGAIVVITNGIMQAHLLGTRDNYLAESPAKLLTEEITIIGRELGVKYYNLGGGLGFKEDSLFRWKANFSGLTFDYRSWRYVANQEVYKSLLTKQEIEPDTEVDFFPLYRLQTNKA